MNEMQIFQNARFGEIRTVMIDDEVWFVGKDVAAALGYNKTENALARHVDEDDTLKRGITDAMGRLQDMTIINESGLYALIFGSKLDSAKEFKHWVTSDVLPTIRKSGAYHTPGNIAASAYSTKPTSVGEIAQLLKVLRATMKDNSQPGEVIAQTVKEICGQFHIRLPDNFVRRDPFLATQLSYLAPIQAIADGKAVE